MKRIRTFIAIDPGKKIRGRLASLQEKLMQKDVNAKWVERDNLHITLLFLGEVEYVAVPDICNAVADSVADTGGIAATFNGVGCFPNMRRPRILWAGVTEGRQEICAVHDAVEKPLLKLGCYRREKRKFTPHVTLGRLQKDRQQNDLSALLSDYADWKVGDAQIDEVIVMNSELTPAGPRYTVLGRAPLT